MGGNQGPLVCPQALAMEGWAHQEGWGPMGVRGQRRIWGCFSEIPLAAMWQGHRRAQDG